MKEIDYKQLKKYSNLPKFDIGTRPIGSGYQRNADQTQTGYFTQTAEPVTNAFVPRAISSGIQNVASPLLSLGKNAVKYISEYRSVLPSALEDSAAKYANLYAKAGASSGFAEDAFVKAGQTAAKNTAKSAASKAIGAANIALNAYGAIHGGIDLLNNWKDSSTLSSEDLSNMASRSTEYVNGVAYDRIGGYDSSGVDKYVRDQNKASKIGGITSGLEAGAGIGGLIGSIFPGAGTLIGSGIGAVVGAIGGLFGGSHARRKRERAIAEAKRNYANAADAYNSQNESEAASIGLRNEYYTTHADKGLSPAFVGGGETIVRTDGNKIIGSEYIPITKDTPRHGDNILANVGPEDGVIGNKIDPRTGIRFSDEAKMAKGNNRNKILKDLLEMQARTPDNRYLESFYPSMQFYDRGKKPKSIANRAIDWLHENGLHSVGNALNDFNRDVSHMLADFEHLGIPTNMGEIANATTITGPIGAPINRIPGRLKVYNKGASVADDLIESVTISGNGVRKSTPFQKAVPNYQKWGSDIVKTLKLPTLAGANGKNYIKLPDGKLQSVESIGRKYYDQAASGKWQDIQKALIPSFDGGIWKGSEMPITNYLLNYVDNNARRKQIEREPIQVNESYAPNPYISQAGALMPTMVDVSSELSDLNDQVRMANYAINQSAYTPGQRMAMLSQLYNNSIKNRSKIIASKTDRENAMRQQYAQWLSQVGESDAARRQQSRAAYNQSKQQAYAQKRLLLDNIAKDKRGDLNNFFQNLSNIYWGNKNINLYQQDLDRKDRDLLKSLNNKPVSKSTLAHDINSLKFNPTYKLFNPTYSLSDAMFGNFSPFFHFKTRR